MILIYNMERLESDEYAKLINLLNRFDAPWRQVNEYDFDTTVGDLLAKVHTDLNPAPKELPEETFMLMEADDAFLDRMLAGLKEIGVKIPYKAMVTDTNRGWTFGYLMRHVIDEDREMKALVTLQRLMAASAVFQENDYDPEAWADHQSMRAEAEAFLTRAKKGEITPDEAEAMVHTYNESVLRLMGQGI